MGWGPWGVPCGKILRVRTCLLLAARELDALLTDRCVVPFGKGGDEVVSVGEACGGLHLLMRRTLATEHDVPANGARKEDWLLRDEADLRAKPLDAQLAYVDAIKCERAGANVVEALEEAHEGALAASRGTRERHRRARLDGELEALVHGHVRTRRVGEVHIAQLDAAAGARRRARAEGGARVRRRGAAGGGRGGRRC